MAGSIKSRFVVDASFVANFLLPDEESEFSNNFFEQLKTGEIQFISTALLSFEVSNTLKIAINRKRISYLKAKKLVRQFCDYNISIKAVDFEKCLALANQKDITVYDASYLYLAIRYKIPLLTLDKKLKGLSPNFN